MPPCTHARPAAPPAGDEQHSIASSRPAPLAAHSKAGGQQGSRHHAPAAWVPRTPVLGLAAPRLAAPMQHLLLSLRPRRQLHSGTPRRLAPPLCLTAARLAPPPCLTAARLAPPPCLTAARAAPPPRALAATEGQRQAGLRVGGVCHLRHYALHQAARGAPLGVSLAAEGASLRLPGQLAGHEARLVRGRALCLMPPPAHASPCAASPPCAVYRVRRLRVWGGRNAAGCGGGGAASGAALHFHHDPAAHAALHADAGAAGEGMQRVGHAGQGGRRGRRGRPLRPCRGQSTRPCGVPLAPAAIHASCARSRPPTAARAWPGPNRMCTGAASHVPPPSLPPCRPPT